MKTFQFLLLLFLIGIVGYTAITINNRFFRGSKFEWFFDKKPFKFTSSKEIYPKCHPYNKASVTFHKRSADSSSQAWAFTPIYLAIGLSGFVGAAILQSSQ